MSLVPQFEKGSYFSVRKSFAHFMCFYLGTRSRAITLLSLSIIIKKVHPNWSTDKIKQEQNQLTSLVAIKPLEVLISAVAISNK